MGSPSLHELQDFQDRVLGRFGVLLIALIFFLVTTPFAEHTPMGEMRFRIMFTLVLLVGVYTMSDRHGFWVALGLGLLSFVGSWIETFVELDRALVWAYGASVVFLGYVALVVLAAVLRERRVTTDTVLGGICVYFLIGVAWTLLYAIVIVLQPEAILIGGEPIEDSLEEGASALLYFSFVTLTTLGYGDVAPHTDIARMLAAGEAVIGQLFIAVLIARLVGMHISTTGRPDLPT